MTRYALTLLCAILAATASAGGNKPAVRIIDGKEVVAKRVMKSQPIVEIRNLRFYDCVLKDSDAPCTTVIGDVVSHLPTRDFNITVKFTFFDRHLRRGTFHIMGTAEVVVPRPEPEKPTRFSCLGPDATRNRDADPIPATFSGYTVSIAVTPYKATMEWK